MNEGVDKRKRVQYLIDNVSKILAVLVAEQGGYTYVDKLGYAPSADLALYYIREALRDFHSLLRKGSYDNPNVEPLIEGLKDKLSYISQDLDLISDVKDRRELRSITSLISSKALALAGSLGLKT